ncbi:hypothetical protein ACRCD8_05415 [Aliarcobacter sp. ERUVET-8]|uniref:hypothetical protein n=1 Tax=Aliarcobacter sp. ERUVET-8 TaxID=3429684 RepID=UPI003D6B9B76
MITEKELEDAILLGIVNSQKSYFEWSNEWLSFSPEYLITVKIAEEISKINKNKFVTLEDNVEYILNLSKAKGRGKISNSTRANGRYDIVVWWANGHPRAVVEVKNSVRNFKKIEEDVKRVCNTLNRKTTDSTLKQGFIAFYIDNTYVNNAREKLNNQIENIFQQTKFFVTNQKLKIELIIYENHPICEDDKNAYAAVIFLIKK